MVTPSQKFNGKNIYNNRVTVDYSKKTVTFIVIHTNGMPYSYLTKNL